MLPILKPEIQDFIDANLHEDLHLLLLKKSPFQDVTMQEIVRQILGIRIALKKFPFLVQKGIIFPPPLNLEQTSSVQTAEYKSTLVSGYSLVDLTTGFGIDAFFMSKNFSHTTLVEKNESLLKIVKHNWQILNRTDGIEFKNEDLHNVLNSKHILYDWVYLDPSRRDAQKKKVFLLEDLSPNLLEVKEQLLLLGENVLIKLSPLIDLTYLMSVLEHLTKIHIVALKNEVKEILIELHRDSSIKDTVIHCINLESNDSDFEFSSSEMSAQVAYSDVGKYLYILNNAILKSGAFNLVAQRFSLSKLHPNTHFYTSDVIADNFPGRVLQVEVISSKSILPKEKYNIIAKNYPLKPEEIKKKYKISDGGEQYLIFTQTVHGKVILRSV